MNSLRRFLALPALLLCSILVAPAWSVESGSLIDNRITAPLLVQVDPKMGFVTPGFAGTTVREVGRYYSITASPMKKLAALGYLFQQWEVTGVASLAEIGVTEEALLRPTLTFRHVPGLQLTPRIVPNPFRSAGETYASLVFVGFKGGYGMLTITMRPSGAFTGRCIVEGQTFPVAGLFNPDGNALFGPSRSRAQILHRPGKPALLMQLSWEAAGGDYDPRPSIFCKLHEVTNPDAEFPYYGWAHAYLPAYNGTTRVPPSNVLGPRQSPGAFTALLSPFRSKMITLGGSGTATTGMLTANAGLLDADNAAANAPNVPASANPAVPPGVDFPSSCGFANLTMTKSGAVTLIGVLPDNTPVIASSVITTAGCPFFVPLYRAQGVYSADLYLDATSYEGAVQFSGSSWWARPAMDTQHYPEGWPTPIECSVFGARYRATPGQSIFTPRAGGVPEAPSPEGNMRLQAWSDTEEIVHRPFNISSTDGVTRLPANDPAYTLTVNRSTGRFTGRLRSAGGIMVPFQGIVYQSHDEGTYGAGYFLSSLPVVKDYQGYSGQVRIAPPSLAAVGDPVPRLIRAILLDPALGDIIQPAYVQDVTAEVSPSQPPQLIVRIRGSLADGATRLHEVKHQRVADGFVITVTTARAPHVLATQALVPYNYELTISLEGVPSGPCKILVGAGGTERTVMVP